MEAALTDRTAGNRNRPRRPFPAATVWTVLGIGTVVLAGGWRAEPGPPFTTPAPPGSPPGVVQDTPATALTVEPLPLPGANGLVMLDYVAYDRASNRLWVPAGNTGSVDVIDGASDEITRIAGFAVGEVALRGKRRPFGPSSVSIGDGVAYVGNRADSKVCVIAVATLTTTSCFAFAPPVAGLAAAPDAIIYVAATRELWVTTGAPPVGVPAADPAIQILRPSRTGRLERAGKIPLPGSAEGYAVDNRHERFYTNLEETGTTLAIDVKARAVVARWRSCAGPSGLAVDGQRGFVFVACGDHVIVLDTAHGGRVVGSLSTGGGVDNIDYTEATGLLYAAAADAARLTIAHIDDSGRPSPVATAATTKGARSVVAGSSGHAYVIDPVGGRILKVVPAVGPGAGRR